MSLSYTLKPLILALFPLVSASVSDLVTCFRIQREELEISSTQFQPGDAHAPTKSFPAFFLSINLPQAWPTPKAFLTLTSTHSHTQHQPHPCPRLPRIAFEGQRSQNSLCSQHPPSPLNCSRSRRGAESPVLGRGGDKGGGIFAQIRGCKAAAWQQPHLDRGSHLQRYRTQIRPSPEHHKRETHPFCNFMLLISSHLKPSIFFLLSRALYGGLRGKLE